MSWVDDFSYLLQPVGNFDIAESDAPLQYSKYIDVHVPGHFPDLSEVELALIGVGEGRRSASESVGAAPDFVRKALYTYFHHGAETRIADLGTIKAGDRPEDTDHALQLITKHLIGKRIAVIIIGGGQELTLPIHAAYEALETTVNLTVVDAAIDMGAFQEELSPINYLSKIVLHEPSYLFNLSILGYQTYMVDPANLELMEKLFFDVHRLGSLNADIKLSEPYFRNADIVSFDFNAVRNAAAPGTASPNGFTGDQMCQMARYAGLSDKTTALGFFNYDPGRDVDGQSAALLAQMIWCAIDGFSLRQKEFPLYSKKNFVEYKVHLPEGNDELLFYKSKRTDKWWLNVPYSGGDNGKLAGITSCRAAMMITCWPARATCLRCGGVLIKN